MKPSLSVVIPAYNEEAAIEAALRLIGSRLEAACGSHEIILVDDGSGDRTAEIAERLAKADPRFKVVRNEGNRGIGYSMRRGMGLAALDYVTFWSADADMPERTLRVMLDGVGKADLVIPYIANPEYRPPLRRLVSRGYSACLNRLFGFQLRYYNGPTIYPRAKLQELLRAEEFVADGYVFMAELLLRMLRRGSTYVEVPTYHGHVAGAVTRPRYLKRGITTLKGLWRLYRTF